MPNVGQVDLTKCGAAERLELGRDPQSKMIRGCIDFQRRLGLYDDRLSDMPKTERCDPRKAIHHLDMAVHEAHECWDQLEGGWKHHKTKPREVDPAEVLMELADVLIFVYNAYAYMGGQPERELVAAAANRGKEGLAFAALGLEEAWSIGVRSWEKNAAALLLSYGHGDGAHGPEWVKTLAGMVNHLATQIRTTVTAMREMLAMQGTLPASSGFVYMEIVPWVCCCASLVEGVEGPVDLYSVVMRKIAINNERQDRGY